MGVDEHLGIGEIGEVAVVGGCGARRRAGRGDGRYDGMSRMSRSRTARRWAEQALSSPYRASRCYSHVNWKGCLAGGRMPESLDASPDGLRRAASHSDDLASSLSGTTNAGSAGGSQPTAAAVRAVHALVTSVRADQAAFLSGRSGTLRAGANGYENTDSGSAKTFGETMQWLR